VDFDSRFVGESTLSSGPATVDAVSYAQVWYAGVRALNGETMVFPTADTNLELSSPFSLASDLADRSFLEGYLTSDLLAELCSGLTWLAAA
jgi:hypothetical protein